MNLIRIYGLFLRHFYLITRSFPRILDLIYWPSIQITLWGFISNFFAAHSSYYSGAVGVILSCAILYDFLFRTSIGFNMLFLEEIWSRNFTNLFIAPMKISEIIISLVLTWNEYFFAALLTSSHAKTLPVMVASQTGSQGISWWSMAALSLAAILPLIIIAVILERYIIKGMAAGAVK